MSFQTNEPDDIRNDIKKIDGVIVDDDERFVSILLTFAFGDQTIDQYHNPEHFLKDVSQYSKETKMLIDNNFNTSSLKGFDVAKQLHDLGYKNIYILSGETFDPKEIPDYVTVVRKDDIEKIKSL